MMIRKSLVLTTLLTLASVAALSLPALALAQDGAGEAAGGLPVLLIAGIAGAIGTLLVSLSQLFPGYGTYLAIGATVFSGLATGLTELGQQHPVASAVAVGMAALSGIVARFRSESRAEAKRR